VSDLCQLYLDTKIDTDKASQNQLKCILIRSTSTFSILFFVKKHRASHGEAPIYVHILVDGKRMDLSIKRKIALEKWDESSLVVFTFLLILDRFFMIFEVFKKAVVLYPLDKLHLSLLKLLPQIWIKIDELAESMRSLVEAFNQSGMTQKGFSGSHETGFHKLNCRVRKLRDEDAKKRIY